MANQPGLILADEVGMGKTFVAMDAAASVTLSDPRRRPVVAMVPPALKEKWPLDFSVFLRECLPPSVGAKLRSATAHTAAQFLQLLDDPLARRASIIFRTQGAMHRGLQRGHPGGWIKLAVIQRALHRRKYLHSLRKTLYQRMGDLLEMGWVERYESDIWRHLLDRATTSWRDELIKFGIVSSQVDDPVPKAVDRALAHFASHKLDQVVTALFEVPMRLSDRYAERINAARAALNGALKELWRECLQHLNFRLPLLILDEAHHLKNPETRFASLFQNEDAEQDATTFGGELNGIFEWMLFLTATPFQLGHHELCQVLDRFGSIAWNGHGAPNCGTEASAKNLAELRSRLDAAKSAAVRFDATYGRLTAADLTTNGNPCVSVDDWWLNIPAQKQTSPAVDQVLESYQETNKRMRSAEEALRPWVIRHLRPRLLSGKYDGQPWRKKLPGRSIQNDEYHPAEPGLELAASA